MTLDYLALSDAPPLSALHHFTVHGFTELGGSFTHWIVFQNLTQKTQFTCLHQIY